MLKYCQGKTCKALNSTKIHNVFLTIFNRVGIFFPAEPEGCQWCCIPDMEVRRQIPDSSALALQHKHLIDVPPYFGIKMVLKIWLWYENYPI